LNPEQPWVHQIGLASLWAAAALTLIAGASAGVNTPHSGWYSGNPTLGPNSLTDLVCGGTTCYAAGAFGTLLQTTNAGSSWSGVAEREGAIGKRETGIRKNLRTEEIRYENTKIIFICR